MKKILTSILIVFGLLLLTVPEARASCSSINLTAINSNTLHITGQGCSGPNGFITINFYNQSGAQIGSTGVTIPPSGNIDQQLGVNKLPAGNHSAVFAFGDSNDQVVFFQVSERDTDTEGGGGGTTPESIKCNDQNSINTAIGCIPIGNVNELAGFFLRWGIGIAGGLAMIFIVYAGILLLTSSGDPKKVQAGRELLTAAIAGLVFLVFSIFVLRVVGIDILQIPGLQ